MGGFVWNIYGAYCIGAFLTKHYGIVGFSKFYQTFWWCTWLILSNSMNSLMDECDWGFSPSDFYSDLAGAAILLLKNISHF
jgi:hypothetical protein